MADIRSEHVKNLSEVAMLVSRTDVNSAKSKSNHFSPVVLAFHESKHASDVLKRVTQVERERRNHLKVEPNAFYFLRYYQFSNPNSDAFVRFGEASTVFQEVSVCFSAKNEFNGFVLLGNLLR